jgi:TonB family protein
MLRMLARYAFIVAVIAGSIPLQASAAGTFESDKEKREGSAAFTLNRVRLYIVYARQGEARVVLPPLNGHYPDEVINDAVDNTIKALEHIRKQYSFSDLEVVNQYPYLLQLIHAKGGGYEYKLNPEEGGVVYSAGTYEGVLNANTEGNQLNLELGVLKEREPVFNVSLQLIPGRTLVFGLPLPGGDAIFAVLTVNTPETGPQMIQSDNTEDGESVERDRIHMQWDNPPRLINSPQPDYPDIAYRAGVEGTVTLHVIVGTDGSVEDVKVAHSSPSEIFSEAARKAVLKWRYEPATIDGEPVRALCSQTIRFVLSENSSSYF